jgi:hypothetical protein
MMISLTRETAIHWSGAALAAVALLLSAPGCAQDTAIIIEVTRGELAAEPDALRFFVGVDAGELDIAIPGCGTAARFVDESGDFESVVTIGERDLAADPYRLLLRPGAALPLDQELMVVVAALRGERVLGMGSLQAPVRFRPDKALEWQVKVEPLVDALGILGSGCACARLGSGGVVVVTPTDDRDCDGDVGADDCNDHDATVGKTKSEICYNGVDDDCDGETDEVEDADGDGFDNCKDCNDSNPAVYPDAPEICDGFDSDCSADTVYPEQVWCYVDDSGECYLGTRVCNDLDPLGGGWQNDCTPLGQDPQYIAPRELCDVFDQCTDTHEYGDGFECANLGTFAAVTCTQYVLSDANGGKTLCEGRLPLPGPADRACTWTLLGGENQGPYVASLFSEETGDVAPVVNDCMPQLVTRELSEEPYETSIRLWLEVDGSPLYKLQLDVKPEVAIENACPVQGQGLVCAPLPLPALR